MRKLLLGVLVLCLSVTIRADLIGFVGQGKEVYRTNFDTGQQIPIILNGLSVQVDYFESFAVSPIDNYLYAIGHWSNYLTVGGRQIERSLYKIDPTTGDVTNNVAFLSAGHGLWCLPDIAISPDNIPYAIEKTSSRYLYALIDPTGESDWIGVTYIDQLSNQESTIAIDSFGQAITWTSSFNGRLYHLNLTDASATLIGNLNGDFSALHYAPDGTLYGWGNKTIYEIDINNLTAISLGSFGYGDSPFAILPEPTTVLLLGLGGVLLRRRKR